MWADGCGGRVVECVEDADGVGLVHQAGDLGLGGPAEADGFVVGGQRSPGGLAAEHEVDDGAGHVVVDPGQGDGLGVETQQTAPALRR
jgi:hypothetical protein